MKIALVSSAALFVDGGYRFIVDWLEPAIRDFGHEVERIYLPSSEAPETLLDELLAYRLMDLSETADRVITFRPPAHLINHPEKVVWFIHHYRAWYDLWDSEYCPIPSTPRWRGVRQQLIRADTNALAEARRVYCNSATVADRVRRFNGIESEVLYPPLSNPDRFRNDTYGDEILCICRFARHKRQHLLVEAMRHVRTPVRLRLCGSRTPYVDELERIAADLPRGKVSIEARWISEQEKVDRLASALAVAYFPIDEDSYGYPTLEAAHARKAALVASDGGGVTELVRHGTEGMVLDPDPRAIADAFDHLWSDRKTAATMGEAAFSRVIDLGIGWPRVVEALLS